MEEESANLGNSHHVTDQEDGDETMEQIRQMFVQEDENCETCEKREKWLDYLNLFWNVVLLILEILDMITDTMLYFHIAKMMPANSIHFTIAYLCVLILSFLFSFLPQVSLTLIDIIGDTCVPNVGKLLDHKRLVTLANVLSLLVEDFGVSLVLLLTLLKSGSCAYAVSLTYTKSAVLSCFFTLLASWGKSVGLLIANRRTLWVKNVNVNWKKVAKVVVKNKPVSIANISNTEKTVSAKLYYFIYVICILYAPLSVSIFVAINLIYLLVNGSYSRLYDRFSHVIFYRLLLWWMVLNLPTFLAMVNLIYMYNVELLAAVTTCEIFGLTVGLTARYPVGSCLSGNYSDMCNVTLQALTTAEIRGSSLMHGNRAILDKSCSEIFAPSTGLSHELSRFLNGGAFTNSKVADNNIAQCTVFTVISYSTTDFQPEFNVAFRLDGEDYSTCSKPFIRNRFSKTYYYTLDILQIVGTKFCHLTDNNTGRMLFERCDDSVVELQHNGIPCFDCQRNCYQWLNVSDNENVFNNELEFVGISRVGDTYVQLRYNPYLPTPCDVDLDWKIHKYFCI